MQALQKAIEAAGGTSRLAEAVGVSTSTPSMWKARGRVPAEYCAAIERAAGGVITRKDLRPDDWAAIWPELVTQEPAEASNA